MMRSAVASTLLLASSACAEPRTGGDTLEVEATLQAYEQAWSRHDSRAVAGFYNEPALRVTPAGPAVRPTKSDQEAFFASFLAGLVARGYARSGWEELHVRLLDPRTAIASGVTVRYREDGSVLERVALTYGLWRTEAGWKIYFSATHPAGSVLHFQ